MRGKPRSRLRFKSRIRENGGRECGGYLRNPSIISNDGSPGAASRKSPDINLVLKSYFDGKCIRNPNSISSLFPGGARGSYVLTAWLRAVLRTDERTW